MATFEHMEGFFTLKQPLCHRRPCQKVCDTTLTGAFGNWRPYLKANIWQDWVDEDTAVYAGVHTVDSEHASTALELGGGVVANLGPRWGLWADADYTQDIDGEEREVVRGTAGLRVMW